MSNEQTVPNKLSPEERAQRNLLRQHDAAEAMAEHERTQTALYANMERLRAERLKREADAPAAEAPKPRRARKAAAVPG